MIPAMGEPLQVELGQPTLIWAGNGYLRGCYSLIKREVLAAGASAAGSYGERAQVLWFGPFDDGSACCSRLDGRFADNSQAVPLSPEQEAVWRLTGKGPKR